MEEQLIKLADDLDNLIKLMNENPRHFFTPLGKSKKRIERNLKKQKNSN